MYEITIRCEKFGAMSPCRGNGWLTDNLAEPIPARVLQELAEHGWVERDGKHYCPRHDPAQQGVRVSVGLDYVELAPGVRARWPGAEREGDCFPIEVQVDDRECHGQIGAICGGGRGPYGG